MTAKLEGDTVQLTPETFGEQCWLERIRGLGEKITAELKPMSHPNSLLVTVRQIPPKAI